MPASYDKDYSDRMQAACRTLRVTISEAVRLYDSLTRRSPGHRLLDFAQIAVSGSGERSVRISDQKAFFAAYPPPTPFLDIDDFWTNGPDYIWALSGCLNRYRRDLFLALSC